jgi:hypothetical protein
MYKLLLNSNMYKLTFLFVLLVILFLVKKVENFALSDFTDSFPVDDIDTFKYLNTKSGFTLDKDTYENLSMTPKLVFKSFDKCPNLYNLFHGIKLKGNEGKFIRGENSEGIRFRNQCERIFYNTTQFIRIEHPIIDIEGEDIDPNPEPLIETFSTDETTETSRIFKDRYQEFTFAPFKDESADVLEDKTKKINYLPNFDDDKTKMPRFCNFNKKVKEINFGVKSDFKLEDIMRFVDYCFTQLCLGMIYIENMRLTSNHYRVFPCICAPGSFFILPERIRHIAAMEGKYYSRAKCNACCMNLLVLNGRELPNKFDFIYKMENTGACGESNDIFKSEEELDTHEF